MTICDKCYEEFFLLPRDFHSPMLLDLDYPLLSDIFDPFMLLELLGAP